MSSPYPEENYLKKELSPQRKRQKIVVEKKRRNRINSCLDELKSLLVDSLNQQNPQIAKLEKGDILELAVKQLKHIQRQQTSHLLSNPENVAKYSEGFSECAGEVMRYVSSLAGFDSHMKLRLMEYLSNRSSMNHGMLSARACRVPPGHPPVSCVKREIGDCVKDFISQSGGISVAVPSVDSTYLNTQIKSENGLHCNSLLNVARPIPTEHSNIAQKYELRENVCNSLPNPEPLVPSLNTEAIASLKSEFSAFQRHSLNCGIQASRVENRSSGHSHNNRSVWRPW